MDAMRLRPLWAWRLLLGGFALVYLWSPTLQAWLPPLVPFVAAAAVEAQFFLAGLRTGGSSADVRDAGPQPRDLADLGWASRTLTVSRPGGEWVLRPGELEDEEVFEWLELHRDELEALGPGRHELAAITDAGSPVALDVAAPASLRHVAVTRRLVPAAIVLSLLAAAFFLDIRTAHWQRLSAPARAATLSLVDRQATRIAGHPAHVICDVSGRRVGYVQDADGLAELGGRRIWLTPQICFSLYRVEHSRRAGNSSGHAIAVLAHEAWHLHGEADEAIANCYAYQSGVGVGEALGLTAHTARELMHRELADNPGDFADAPRYVVPSGCRPGGALDLHLDPHSFP
jgi:hypothetical protein